MAFTLGVMHIAQGFELKKNLKKLLLWVPIIFFIIVSLTNSIVIVTYKNIKRNWEFLLLIVACLFISYKESCMEKGRSFLIFLVFKMLRKFPTPLKNDFLFSILIYFWINKGWIWKLFIAPLRVFNFSTHFIYICI